MDHSTSVYRSVKNKFQNVFTRRISLMKNDMINLILFKQVFLKRCNINKYNNISILANVFQLIQQPKFFASWYLFRREKKYFIPFHPRGSP